MGEDIRVLLVDDHTIVRQGFRKLLEESGIGVVGEASNGRESIRKARELKPDVVIMDIKLPHLNGIEATRKITGELPSARVIMLTVHLDELYVYRSLDAGARGYLVKETAAEDLLNAIHSVMEGEIYLSDNFPSDLLDKYRKMKRAGKKIDEFSKLTRREREILQLIAEGYTSKRIGEILFISRKTVENHRANIMRKLDIHDMAGLIRYAIRIGLVDSGVEK